MPNSATAAIVGERQIAITRTFDAPRELVFDAFIDTSHKNDWWGPDGFTTTTLESDVRPGGVWRFVMHGPDGVDYPNRIAYTEIVRPERIAYEHDDDGAPDGRAFSVTITLVALDDRRTELTMTSTFASAEERQFVIDQVGAIEGGKQTLARLAAYLERAAKD